MTTYQHDRAARDRRREPEYDFGCLNVLAWLLIVVTLAMPVVLS